MDFGTLVVVGVAALVGPLVAVPRRLRVPVVVGELVAGIAVGGTGLRLVDAADPTFAFLGQVGFALVMFVAGSHVPLRDPLLRQGARAGLLRALAVGVLAVPAGWGLAAAFGTGHGALYAVLLASSSAALVLPILQGSAAGGEDTTSGTTSRPLLELLPQVAVADAACIVLLPLAAQPRQALHALLGVVVVGGLAGASYLGLRWAERSGHRHRLHDVSEDHGLALELRVSLLVLFALAAVAVEFRVSVLLAGFALGLAVAGVGEPRRLARQLFGITEGFLGPLFFVWLGASLDLRSALTHPSSLLLGLALGVGALVVHGVLAATGQPLPLALLAGAQLGVPVAAVTVGTQLGVLAPGEGVAMVLGALVTVAAATACGSWLARHPA